jgi:hypothetical protein
MNYLSDQSLIKLTQYLRNNKAIAVEKIASLLNCNYDEALAIAIKLEESAFVENFSLIVYHRCNLERIADSLPYGVGFPNLPFFCPLCNKHIVDLGELSFDILMELSDRAKISEKEKKCDHEA